MNIPVYTLTSPLHNENNCDALTRKFIHTLACMFIETPHVKFELKGQEFSDFGQQLLNLIYIVTGGTEATFKQILPSLQRRNKRPFYLLTSGKNNSLAASLEILSYLRQQGIKGEIIHGNTDYVAKRIKALLNTEIAMKRLQETTLGIIGQPSDWLISSGVSPVQIKHCLGIQLINIHINELLQKLKPVQNTKEGAENIYNALRNIVQKYELQGFTLRCFDLLTAVRNTGCLALARLNAEGTVAGCEGDVPALISMTISNALTGVSGFQANPAYIDIERGEIIFAHCTIPLNMVEHYELHTHFESGLGIAIRGFMKEGPVTIFKVAGDLSRYFVAEGMLIRNLAEENLCRTQQLIRLSHAEDAEYFLKNPIGNHHIIIPGHHKQQLEEIMT